MKDVTTLILGGGKGTRLRPLTYYRSKAAVPIGGKYRLIDIPMSNCINSGLRKIYILTQFNSHSLHQHVHSSYNFDHFSDGFVNILAAEQSPSSEGWYEGTADSVRKNMAHIKSSVCPDDLILILSGDHLYSYDFKELIRCHKEKKADITICSKEVTREVAQSCGLFKVEVSTGQISEFYEKPKEADKLNSLQLDNGSFLASMGIYIFNAHTLFELLTQFETEDDFGKGIIPHSIQTQKVFPYIYEGYWEDIGTIQSFYRAGIDIAKGVLPFSFQRIFSHPYSLSPIRFKGSVHIKDSVISEGGFLGSSVSLNQSSIGIRSFIEDDCYISNSIIMGNDKWFIAGSKEKATRRIGKGSQIKNAIIDKNVTIGQNVKIVNEARVQSCKNDFYEIKEGIVIIPKGSIIPDNTVI